MAFNGSYGGNPRYGQDPYGPPPANLGMAGARAGYRQPVAGMYTMPYASGQGPYYYNAPVQGAQLNVPRYLPSTFAPAQISPLAQAGAVLGGQDHGRQPQLDRNFRTCNMRNSTGGYGCEPGYNYFFPAEHTKIHVLKTGSTPPWQLPANFVINFNASHVPVSTTVADLMKGFGATNMVPKKNVITEVCPGGGGRWYKGIELRGDDSASMKLPIKELGWDSTRTGLRGEKKVVYIYVQKD